MKNVLTSVCEFIGVVAVLLAVFYLDLVICGIQEPKKMDIVAAYQIPVIGTLAKNQVNQFLALAERR